MTYTPPTADDLAALEAAASSLSHVRAELLETEARITLVHDRLSAEPPPPPPEIVLPAVGVGGSGAFNALPRSERQQVLALAAACGITYWRFSVSWSQCENKQGVYKFDGPKQMASDIVAAGLKPQALVGWTPPWCRINGAAGANSAPKNDQATRNAWYAFIVQLMQALYPIGVRRYEIWNEPNFAFMQPVSPTVWTDLVFMASAAATEVSRRIRIISGGLCPAVDEPPRSMGASKFMDAVLAYEPTFFQQIDAFGIHPYAAPGTKLLDGAFWRKHVTYLQTLLPADVPLCGTEHGWKSGKDTEPKRAELYVDSVVSFPDQREPLFLFSMFDFAEPFGLVTSSYQPKPVYDALAALLT